MDFESPSIRWSKPANVKANITSRMHGNLATHAGGDPEAVINNREQLTRSLQLPTQPNWLKQTHSTVAVAIDSCPSSPEADACFTQTANTVCAVLTADCLPLLICNQAGNEVAAIHAGWRGLMNGIIDNTLHALSSKKEELLVWLGPAIGPQALQLNADIRAQFIERLPDFADGFTQYKGAWFADIYQLARINLANHGVYNVTGGTHCTYTEKELFFSYRREGDNAGRMASLIYFTPPG